MDFLKDRLKHYQKAFRIQSKELEEKALLGEFHRLANHFCERGDIEKSRLYLKIITELNLPKKKQSTEYRAKHPKLAIFQNN